MEKMWVKSWPDGIPQKLDFPNKPLYDFLRDNAERNPKKVAINYYGREIGFQELDDLSDRFAAALNELGLKKGGRVSLYLENCPQFVIAYFGTLKAGGVVVAANPMFKEDELLYELKDSGTKIIIALDHLYPLVREIQKKIQLSQVIVTSYWDFLPENPELPIHPSMQPPKEVYPRTLDFLDLLEKYEPEPPQPKINLEDDLALLQYTSGTTGLPKGAMITHYSLLFNTVGSAVWTRITEDDVHLSVLPFFHVTGMIHGMNRPIYTGTTNVMISRFDTETAIKAIDDFRCTVWVSITTMNVAVVNFSDIHKYNLQSLKHCSSGGAPIPGEILHKWREIVGPELVEGYGLSETISQTHINPISNPRYGSVGIPHFGVECRIVDVDTQEELPIGEEGELIIKGPMVTKGYWNNPKETEKVLKDGWFATGDIARMDHDGYFYIVERKKDMIKASGYSVFPAEVEALLYEHPAVQEVAVIGVPDPHRGENIKAIIILRPQHKGLVKKKEMIAWAKNKMAAYKYPRIVEFVDELPKTGSGKILKRALRERERDQCQHPNSNSK
ncbi:Long-chain-fatty-acid--CoA ligase (EC [Olavius sp. associated proteobacterium Delta 1]|nr:Long-chain-fatty-acid--CoA ligase (EC [Olavius sp. associated proteobacterium Delta 1]